MKRINKEFLHTVALHLDLFNTVNGGVSETYAHIKKRSHDSVIEVWAAGVSPEAFKIVLRNNNLTVSSAIQSEHNPNISAPIYSRTFILPPTINLALIDATYQDGKLRIILPYHEAAGKPREINIRHM